MAKLCGTTVEEGTALMNREDPELGALRGVREPAVSGN
jgi:hypothetical protein